MGIRTWVSGEGYTIHPIMLFSVQFSSLQLLSRVWLFAAPWTAACQASLSITDSRSLPKLMFIESVMSSNHLILCHPLLLLSSIFPSIRVFSNESALYIRWPKYFTAIESVSQNFRSLVQGHTWVVEPGLEPRKVLAKNTLATWWEK